MVTAREEKPGQREVRAIGFAMDRRVGPDRAADAEGERHDAGEQNRRRAPPIGPADVDASFEEKFVGEQHQREGHTHFLRIQREDVERREGRKLPSVERATGLPDAEIENHRA